MKFFDFKIFNNKKILPFCTLIILLTLFLPLNIFAAPCGGSAVGNTIFDTFLVLVFCVLFITTPLSLAFPRFMIGINWIVAILIFLLIPPKGFFNLDYTNPHCAPNSIALALKVIVIYIWTIVNIVITRKPKNKILSCIKNGDKKELKSLISQEYNINEVIDNYGWTPVFYAVKYNKKEIVKLLISKGANVNILDTNFDSPLDFAQTDEMKQFLISHGAKSGKELKEN